MNSSFRPIATIDGSALHISFRDPASKASSLPIKVVVDVDEFGSPIGVEILGCVSQIGANAIDGLVDILDRSAVRFSYDPETDAAAIGVAVGNGTRTAGSAPKQAEAFLDSSSRLVMIKVHAI